VALQPFYDIASGRITGFEALARWSHPIRGKISPAEFVDVAEHSKVIHDLGLFILREACLKLREVPDVTLSVNLSPVQLLDVNLVEKIESTLVETGFPAHRLEFEVTENYLMDQQDRALSVLKRLKAHGITIALDDFGTGYSSLGYLKRYPIDKLKIDRSYILPIETDQRARDIVASIVKLAHAHGLSVTAEGVETIGQARILAETHCALLQGYLIGKGEPAPVLAVPLGMSVLGRSGAQLPKAV
jgi:EAL domain-containing protein (putative c-di-GMP-specific phosphodiesterase class I)